MEKIGILQKGSDRLKDMAVNSKQRSLEGSWKNLNNSSEFGGTQPVDEFSGCGKSR